jgi:hypothetical protein
MANITLSMSDSLIRAGRALAEKQAVSLNGLIRTLLERQVEQSNGLWLEGAFDLMDKAAGRSKGARWKRGDLYDV